jgi:predicted glycosyltransferase
MFAPHSREKIERLRHLGITEEMVSSVVLNPESVEASYFNRRVAQAALTRNLVLRVVFEEINNTLLVVTVYPASRRRYAIED